MDVYLQVKESHCKISNRKMTMLDTLEGSRKLLYNGNGIKLKARGLFIELKILHQLNTQVRREISEQCKRKLHP